MRRKFQLRQAFTLIELLVIIAIIAVLIALTARGTFMVIESQRESNTDTALRTVHQTLQKQWSQVVADAKKEPIPDNVVTLAGGDQERARVIWIKFRLVEAFPVSFNEINNPAVYSNSYVAGGYIPASATRKNIGTYYARLKGKTAAVDPTTESAACLMMALSINRGGAMATEDSLGPNAYDSDGDGFKEVVDGWSRAVTFFRFPTNNAELDASNPAPAGSKEKTRFRDPLDPLGKLADPTWAGRGTFQTICGYTVLDSNGLAFYTVPVVASAGRNSILGLNADMSVINQNDANDNLYSFGRGR